jgi:hypothetical protein
VKTVLEIFETDQGMHAYQKKYIYEFYDRFFPSGFGTSLECVCYIHEFVNKIIPEGFDTSLECVFYINEFYDRIIR